MVRKAHAGHVCGGACYGYRNVEIRGLDGRRSHVERQHFSAPAVWRAARAAIWEVPLPLLIVGGPPAAVAMRRRWTPQPTGVCLYGQCLA